MSGLAELYPFLEPAGRDPAAVLADAVRSTRAKVEEVAGLRAEVVATDADLLASCASAMAARFAAGGRLHAFGNGGSATDADALAALFVDPGPGHRPLPAASLTDDVATLTALANDVGFDVVFSRQIAATAGPRDIAVGLSTSGNSANVLRGLATARSRGMLTVATAGYEGGAMAEAAVQGDIAYLLVVPSASVHRIQEVQTTIYHVLWELVQRALGPAPDDRP